MTDGKTFPAEVVQQIIAKTDGVPLFIEESKPFLHQDNSKLSMGTTNSAGLCSR